MPRAAFRSSASAFAERRREVGTGSPESGSETEDEGGDYGDGRGETENPEVQIDFSLADHEPLDLGREPVPKKIDSEPSEGNRERGPRDREKQVFGQELPDDSRSPGAERLLERQLLFPIGAPREQKVGHVHAGDQQDEQSRRLPDGEKRGRSLVDHRPRERDRA